jgi:DNA end-binding protein Ku
MLEAKVAGQEIVAPEQPEPAKVVDLMQALKDSVAQARKDKDKAAPAAKKKPAARKKRAASGSR